MRSVLILAILGLFTFGCKKGDDAKKGADNKSDCQKAVDNLTALAKADKTEMGQAIAKKFSDEKPEDLVKECDKDAKKHPEGAKCTAAAKSLEEAMKCDEHGGGGGEEKPAEEPKTEEGK